MNRNILIAAAVAVSLPLGAQNLDPTVRVTREYRGKLLEASKPSFKMAVPDSVYKFDLEFDYSVFDNPYKGSYEFTPYLMDMKPQSDGFAGNRLWVRAGAGYDLRPVLDAVWTPTVKNEALHMSVYASNRSYIGRYRDVGRYEMKNGKSYVGPEYTWLFGPKASERTWWKGHDIKSEAGACLRYDWIGGSAFADLGYDGLQTGGAGLDQSSNAVHFKAAVASDEGSGPVSYSVGLSYRYGVDRLDNCYVTKIPEHDFSISARVGSRMWGGNGLVADVSTDIVSYGGEIDCFAGNMSIAPKYFFRKDGLSIDAGLKFQTMIRPEYAGVFPTLTNQTKGNGIYPDVSVTYRVIPDNLLAYLNLGGGNRVDTYYSLQQKNHWFNPYYGGILSEVLMDNTVERFSAVLGFDGNVAGKLAFGLKGGYHNYKNAPVDALVELGLVPGVISPFLAYMAYDELSARADCSYKFRAVDVSAYFLTRHSNIYKNNYSGFELPRCEGGADVRWNLNRRIFAGLSAEAASNRRGRLTPNPVRSEFVPAELTECLIPWYVDLGLDGEYRINRSLSVWAEAGNLLNMSIQRSLTYVENGICFRVGVCYSL